MKDDHCLMSSKLVESGEQIKMGTDRDFFHGHAHGARRIYTPRSGLNSLVEHTRRDPFAKPARIGARPRFK